MAIKMMPQMTPIRVSRFNAKVKKGPPGECWEWTAGRDDKGYGQVRFGPFGEFKKTTGFMAHRIAYFLSTGVDPASLCVCHRCDNPPCCNPAHLFLGTVKDNSVDMVSKGRGINGECHPFTPKHFSANDAYLMREMWLSGLFAQHKIASAFGLSRSVACMIINGKSWRRVPMPPGTAPRLGCTWKGKSRPIKKKDIT